MKTNRLAVPAMILLFGLAACIGEGPAEYVVGVPGPEPPIFPCEDGSCARPPATNPVDPPPIDEPPLHCPRGETCEPVE